ncbi:MAG TPA: OB-fold domain-containing protein, partial [Chloroflexota bacterium]|nr:OB-fold domain-containing protein [Chloroflexota bacterium]
RFRWPPRTFCPACYSSDYEWRQLSGRGTVYTFSVVHHVVVPSFKDEAPYVVAVVTLDGTGDQVRITSNIIDCPWEQVAVGMPLQVTFEDVTSEATLPKFRPAPAT